MKLKERVKAIVAAFAIVLGLAVPMTVATVTLEATDAPVVDVFGIDGTPKAEAHYVANCPHWWIPDGEATAGMGANCTSGAPGTLWSLVVDCTNGTQRSTGWHSQNGYSYGIVCTGTAVVNRHVILFA